MNIEAAKELLTLYKSITIEQIKEKYELYKEGFEVMLHLTGFSSDTQCKLCIGAKAIAKSNVSIIQCKHCIYSLVSEEKSFHCLNETYNKLAHSDTPETTYEALQERIKFLEEAINAYEKL